MKKSSSKRIVMAILFAIVAGVVFASTFTTVGGFGDAKVYDSNYEAIPNATGLTDGYIIQTFNDSVILDDDSTHIEIQPNSLAILVRSENPFRMYLLDGKAIVQSMPSDYSIMTPVTTYNAKAGSTVFVISDQSEELGYMGDGSSVVQNFIYGTTTEVEAGTYIDNSIYGFVPESSTILGINGLEAHVEPMVTIVDEVNTKENETEVTSSVQNEEQTVAPTVVQAEPRPLRGTFAYGPYRIIVTAYKDHAEIIYPEALNEGVLSVMAKATTQVVPDLFGDIYYQLTRPGFATVRYPESYSDYEFYLAMDLISRELPSYINSLFYVVDNTAVDTETVAPEPMVIPLTVPDTPVEPDSEPALENAGVTAPAIASVPEDETTGESELIAVPEVTTSEPVEGETTESTEPAPIRTPLETTPAPKADTEPKKKLDYHIGVWAGGSYSNVPYKSEADGGDRFAVPFTGERLVLFPYNYSFFVRPYFTIEGFTFGLNAEARFVNNKIQVGDYSFDTKNGVFGYINSIVKYVSALSYKSDNIWVGFDIDTPNFDFKSPVTSRYNRKLYDLDNSLVGLVDMKFGPVKLQAVIDDLKFTSVLDGKRQYAGFRAGVTMFDFIEIGASVVTGFTNKLDDMNFYPAVDVTLSNLGKNGVVVELEGAAQFNIKTGYKGAMVRGVAGLKRGAFDFGFGANFSFNSHFSVLLTNAPVRVDDFKEGNTIGLVGKMGVNTKYFTMKTSFNIPFDISGNGGLHKNSIKTRTDKSQEESADVFDFEMNLILGKFTMTMGSSIYGLSGKVLNLFKEITDSSKVVSNLKAFLDTETSIYFVNMDFCPKVGPGVLDVNIRFDLINQGGLRVPMTFGASYKY